MEPLPAAQDALRLELRTLPGVWNLLATPPCPPVSSTYLFTLSSRRETTVDPCSSSSSSSSFSSSFSSSPYSSAYSVLSSARGNSWGRHKPPPTDFTPIMRGESRENPSRNPPSWPGSARAASTVSIAFHWRCIVKARRGGGLLHSQEHCWSSICNLPEPLTV